MRRQGGRDGGLRDPALRTVIAEDGTAVLGVSLAMAGMALHMVTGQVMWEASASPAIGVLLGYVAYVRGGPVHDARQAVHRRDLPARKSPAATGERGGA